MEIEKEVRYEVSKDQIAKILDSSIEYKAKSDMLDITCGYDGFESLKKHGFICRIRQKNGKITLEIKKYLNNSDCYEECITLENVNQGVNYLYLLGMKPYLYLKRQREVRKFKNLKVFIDEFDLIGDYVEIEYQDSPDVKKELEEFINLIGITNAPCKMYGDIVKGRLEDSDFKDVFEEKLQSFLPDEYKMGR